MIAGCGGTGTKRCAWHFRTAGLRRRPSAETFPRNDLRNRIQVRFYFARRNSAMNGNPALLPYKTLRGWTRRRRCRDSRPRRAERQETSGPERGMFGAGAWRYLRTECHQAERSAQIGCDENSEASHHFSPNGLRSTISQCYLPISEFSSRVFSLTAGPASLLPWQTARSSRRPAPSDGPLS